MTDPREVMIAAFVAEFEAQAERGDAIRLVRRKTPLTISLDGTFDLEGLAIAANRARPKVTAGELAERAERLADALQMGSATDAEARAQIMRTLRELAAFARLESVTVRFDRIGCD